LALAVQAELLARLEEADTLRRQQVERARYEAVLARNRFMLVDPNNRLVADTLESDWNDKLRALAASQEQYEQQRQKDRTVLDDDSRRKILALAQDLPRLWQDPNTKDQDRKRMVRLLIEDVTLTKAEQITAQIRFKGGQCRTLTLPIPLDAWTARKTSSEVVRQIDQLLDTCTEDEIATEMNRRGFRTGMQHVFTRQSVQSIRWHYKLKCRYDRLRERGMLTARELARQLGVNFQTVRIWRANGLLIGHPCDGRNECLYEPIGEDGPAKQQGTKLSERRRFPEVTSYAANEVHHEA
jgi:hypothetical protein